MKLLSISQLREYFLISYNLIFQKDSKTHTEFNLLLNSDYFSNLDLDNMKLIYLLLFKKFINYEDPFTKKTYLIQMRIS